MLSKFTALGATPKRSLSVRAWLSEETLKQPVRGLGVAPKVTIRAGEIKDDT
jgi:hypothetical protein